MKEKYGEKKIKRWLLAALTIMTILVMLAVGPLDVFSHGFYCDLADLSQIAAEDFGPKIPLEDGYEMQFTPKKNHFAGFVLYLTDQPEGNSGTLTLTIRNEAGRVIESVSIDLSEIQERTIYRVYTDKALKRGEAYRLSFSLSDCAAAPSLLTADSGYLTGEGGPALLGYAYAKSTFGMGQKLLIVLFVLAAYLFLCSGLLVKMKELKTMALFLFMTALLTQNYMYIVMDTTSISYDYFSETLVSGYIKGVQEGLAASGYGLGRYTDTKGTMRSYDAVYLTDDNWNEGYSRTGGVVLIDSNAYTWKVAAVGNYIRFENGELIRISGVESSGVYVRVYLEKNEPLSPAKYGSLENAVFCDANQTALAPGLLSAYTSQYGLQGKVLQRLSAFLRGAGSVNALNFCCAAASGAVFSVIILLLAKKYNALLARIFFLTFWLSPWIIKFGKNLYWVEFTWFLPMAAGLFCSWKLNSRRCRLLSYGMVFAAVAVKCLCGYEYISSVMMGAIAFLLVDLTAAIAEKDRQQGILACKAILFVGMAALAGFAAALLLHANLRGGGDIWTGLRTIYERDVLRRTSGGNMNDFDAIFHASFNASVWETLVIYFRFSSQVITGIPGNLFPLLSAAPLWVFFHDYYKRQTNIRQITLYVVFFVTAVSWFCLAKGHSYIHTGFNFVLWYFGFVQICLYVLTDKLIRTLRQPVRRSEFS